MNVDIMLIYGLLSIQHTKSRNKSFDDCLDYYYELIESDDGYNSLYEYIIDNPHLIVYKIFQDYMEEV